MAKRKKRTRLKPAPVLARDTAIEMGTRLEDNPDWRPDRDGEKGFPKQVHTSINVRESAVETLFARGHLTQLQKKAADRFRGYYEAYASANVRALDYSRDQVDGGSKPAPVSSQRIHARKELKKCLPLVGKRGYALLVSVCGHGRAFADMYPLTGTKDGDAAAQRQRLTAADNLRDHLYDIGRMWGLGTSNAAKTVHKAQAKAA